ncbi:TIGR02206 family membrane protein [Wukongibacter baidiensis]|uniref:YwaF family protein n=1 Tax=Wukongibacter baidiensis TaxID=1723361 RepID=UPI003D7F4727
MSLLSFVIVNNLSLSFGKSAFNLDSFWNSTIGDNQLYLFSRNHVIALSFILGIVILMFAAKDFFKDDNIRRIAGRILASILFLQSFFQHFWYIERGMFTLKESLPLYLCRISVILCILMIIKESYSIFEIVYFWGLGAATQALLTPDTGGFIFPHWNYIQFFIGHGGTVIAVFFMILAYDYRPTLKSLKKTFNWSYIYLFIVGSVNYLVDGNYSYLRAKPETSSILDYLPSYPYYIPVIVAGLFFIFCLLYLPFHIADIKHKKIHSTFSI